MSVVLTPALSDLMRRDVQRKHLATLQAKAALHGVEIRDLGEGNFSVYRRPMQRECHSLGELHSLLRALGLIAGREGEAPL